MNFLKSNVPHVRVNPNHIEQMEYDKRNYSIVAVMVSGRKIIMRQGINSQEEFEKALVELCKEADSFIPSWAQKLINVGGPVKAKTTAKTTAKAPAKDTSSGGAK